MKPYITSFTKRSQTITIDGKRPGPKAMCQLLTDTLNLHLGRPKRLRKKRFEQKWKGVETGRLFAEIHRLVQNGLGETQVPVDRTLKGGILEPGTPWAWRQSSAGEQVPPEEIIRELGDVPVVQRGHAKRSDRGDYSIIDINRRGVLERNLQQKVHQYLCRDTSLGADIFVDLVKQWRETGQVDSHRFPWGTAIECGTIWSLMLLEVSFLIYTDRHIERCWVADYPLEILQHCGIQPCMAPYFVPARRGTLGCRHHHGREFRNSAAYKRLSRAAPSQPQLPLFYLVPSGA